MEFIPKIIYAISTLTVPQQGFIFAMGCLFVLNTALLVLNTALKM